MVARSTVDLYLHYVTFIVAICPIQAYIQGAVYPGYDSGFLLLLILSVRVFFLDSGHKNRSLNVSPPW